MTLGAEAKLGAGDAALYRQLFRYQEQLEDSIKLRAPRIEATHNTGDTDLDKQLPRYIYEKQPTNKIIISTRL